LPEEIAWYFAYGSNLEVFQMMKRVGEWKTSRRATLEGYRLIFDKESKKWGGFTANVRRTGDASDRVYGVAYELRRKKIEVLSGYEGIDPTTAIAKFEDGSSLDNVSVFLFPPSGQSGLIPVAYKTAILDGLTQHGYGADVITQVSSIMG
jgi:Gamma-glutamyl cyclotransferase, AIG2-like